MSAVSVIVPYYDSPEQLELMLRALERQTWSDLEVVIADDGSARAPRPRTQLRCTVVRQEDRGFRAAAARNLGARAARGSVLCFLDCDTIPEPGYVERVATAVSADPRTLLVGRREHRHLTGPRAGERLTAPAWLAAGYRETDNLRRADGRSYRFVISAVLTMSRRLFEVVGGFDETITGYGGEDWDLGRRCWLVGARLRHDPAAVAVHDGPDFGARRPDPAVKAAESAQLARRITDPGARPRGVVYRRTRVVCDLSALPVGPVGTLCAAQLLRGDVSVVLAKPDGALAEDPRVYVGRAPADVLAAAEYRATFELPIDGAHGVLRRALAEMDRTAVGTLRLHPARSTGIAVTVRSCRSLAGVRLWGDDVAPPRTISIPEAVPTGDVSLEARWASEVALEDRGLGEA